MAAFSTLALIGLAGAAGLIGGKAIAGKGKQEPAASLAAPGPTNAATTAPPAPPSASQQASVGVKAGMQAAGKKRKQAAGGGNRKLSPSIVRPATGALSPATLIGGGY